MSMNMIVYDQLFDRDMMGYDSENKRAEILGFNQQMWRCNGAYCRMERTNVVWFHQMHLMA